MNPWYETGLRFGCTQCGKCCTGPPGVVQVSKEEAEKIAAYLQIPLKDFLEKYTRSIGKKLSLTEKPKNHAKNYDCIFLKGKQCQIYPVRPKQCRTFPFWKQNLSSKAAWEETKKICEGIDHPNGPLISLSQIENLKNER
ncbi:MAG: YkgJ family cysteine cluster protein [Chlamydiae bacterium]|nr:YkgJ family cysteine cluster protein [Chlamydiota bacterium]